MCVWVGGWHDSKGLLDSSKRSEQKPSKNAPQGGILLFPMRRAFFFCACLCVTEREREREKEEKSISFTVTVIVDTINTFDTFAKKETSKSKSTKYICT